MPFTVKNWQDAPSTATPMSAAAFEDMETRLAAYVDARIAEGAAAATFEPVTRPGVFVDGRAGHLIATSTPGFDPLATPGLIGYLDPERIDITVAAHDSFNRADSNALGNTDSGQAWTEHNGDLSIAGRSLAAATPAVYSRGSFDGRLADGRFSALIQLHATSSDVMFVIRQQDTVNHVSLQVRRSNAPSEILQLTKTVAGANTAIPTGFLGAGATGIMVGALVLIELVAVGNVYRLFVDGSERLISGGPFGTDTTNALLNQTRVGIIFNPADAGSKVLDLSVTPTRPPDTQPVAGMSELAAADVGFQATVANRPVMVENALAGRAAFRYNGSGRLSTAVSADGKPMTLMAVVNATTLGAPRTIVSSSANGGITLRAAADGTLELLATNIGSIGVSTLKLVAGRTHLVTVTRETDDTVTFFIDGIPAGATRNAQPVTPGSTLIIGGTQFGLEGWVGDIGPVLVWNRPLQGHELRRNMDGLAGMCGLPLPQRYRRPSVPVRLIARAVGANLHPSQAHFNGMGATPIWQYVWGAGYNQAWNESSVDAAYNAGANAFRAIGDISVTPAGQAAYLARYGSLIDYCAGKGMMFYASAGDLRHVGTATPANIESYVAALAALLAAKPNVIAFELLQEFGVTIKGVSADLTFTESGAFRIAQRLARIARANAPGIPIGASGVGTFRGGFNAERERMVDHAKLRRIADFADYLDEHLYPGVGGMSASEAAALCAATDMPVILGETALGRSASTPLERDTHYRAVADLMNNEPQVMGVFMWAARNDNYGFVSETGAYIGSDIEPGFRTWPTTWT